MNRPAADIANKKWVVASDVRNRDGIGIELYVDETLVLEIFRDDTKMTREVTLHKQEVSLELLEEAIATFKKEIPQDFLD
ncbi:MAG: hypothetical protein ABS37_17135 [Acidovorax sp. SCN 65-108]|uniref:hypothetical protein n=1 Tax=Acidovorax TaxID=12916 RepID=UPI00086A8BA3|nr:hypothetical protein [Acidovorax sp.]ODS60764.1 MAG: hypothetical protein ABS37_17135 [Acidovorax sp. SCN 65-108]OJV74227.1 MAG: hypothetical protein BGO35_18605 [Burkholderiales bacterium 64-34]